MTKVYKNWLLVIVTMFILTVASCAPTNKILSEYAEKTSYDAELLQAYKTYEKCGYKNHYSCETYYGRLQLKDSGKIVERELNGFLYQNFEKAEGKRPVLAYVTMSKRDFGESPPAFVGIFSLLGIIFAVVLLISLFYGMIELPEKVKQEIKNRR